MERIGLTASEEMWFENVDGRRMDGCRMSVLGGTLKFLSRLVLKFNTTFFRKDKWGIILKEIIRTLKIRVLWGFKVVPIGRKRGR